MNELIRELVEALEYEHGFLTGRESHYGESVELLIRARAYLETGGGHGLGRRTRCKRLRRIAPSLRTRALTARCLRARSYLRALPRQNRRKDRTMTTKNNVNLRFAPNLESFGKARR